MDFFTPLTIPTAALLISLTTLLMTALSLRSKAGMDELTILRRRVEDCNKSSAEMREEIGHIRQQWNDCREENLRLLRQIVHQDQWDGRERRRP